LFGDQIGPISARSVPWEAAMGGPKHTSLVGVPAFDAPPGAMLDQLRPVTIEHAAEALPGGALFHLDQLRAQRPPGHAVTHHGHGGSSR